MGKLGGCELNVLFDIDLIFFYDDDGDMQGGLCLFFNYEYFMKFGWWLINVLVDVMEDGYVFCVDMCLCLNGDVGLFVCSLGMLEEYFVVQGCEWECYVWIKGCVIIDLISLYVVWVI